MTTVVYWFRNDLRLADNPALSRACSAATHVLPVYCHDPAGDATTPWGFRRVGAHRRAFLADTLAGLDRQLRARGSRLHQVSGAAHQALPRLAREIGAAAVACEAIAAPEELAEVEALRTAGLKVAPCWQSSLLDPADLPFAPGRMPDVFTDFRRAVELAGVAPRAPLPAPAVLPPPEPRADTVNPAPMPPAFDARSAFPYRTPQFAGGEAAARAHLARYCAAGLPHTYKATRNRLAGIASSSKLSPWLATGALSPRTVHAALQAFETAHGANEGTHWLAFELLWRDYFRFLQHKHGHRLYRARGIADGEPPVHDPQAFARWQHGETGESLVDAGMRELAATGYLSNRMRQIVASYLVHDLACDWRAGAAWFESQLLDFDVASNQGNWLYLAGRGTDPRGGRRFNPRKQAQTYDPDGCYRQQWGTL